MQKSTSLLCKALFDFTNPVKFTTGRVIDRPVAFINGSFITPPSNSAGVATIAVEDPCTNEVIGEIPNLGKETTDQAITEAHKAFHYWRDVVPRERARVLYRWSQLMESYSKSLGHLISRESGKVLAEGIAEAHYAAGYLAWYAGEAERSYGDIINPPRRDLNILVRRQPVGVVAVVTPWNFPAAMLTRAVGGALAAGCTVVVKPSELTPFTALAAAQLGVLAGLPPGALHILTGDPQPISNVALQRWEVRKISFTGSTRVGRQLYEGSAATMKRLGLELGGNAPFIVFHDADLDRAVVGLMNAKFRNAGQACISCNRILVHEDVYEAFLSRLLQKVKELKVGNSFDPSSTMGSLINASAVERIEGVVQDAVEKGAKIEIGGKRINGKGYFFEPTILTSVQHDSMKCCQEEIFGPIIPIMKFNSDKDVVEIANSTPAGLAAYIYTQDYRKQIYIPEQLDFGMIGVNETALSYPCAPFGGVKESGLGRDGSKYGIEEFLDIKYILQSRI